MMKIVNRLALHRIAGSPVDPEILTLLLKKLQAETEKFSVPGGWHAA
ncbi:hypothetical protein MTO98_30755 [Mucilaginibacter sp. SMC90]|nr:hypothetical protein [Mucilaginibacter sp. SMC90]UOE48782.1 hypothetical protein MTO98_30755 [Mucilaginibacter sp. SMC90]